MARFLKNEWLQLLILIAPFIIIACTWNEFPSRVPIHWNFHGRPDNYSNKAVGLLLVPIINIGVAALLGALGKIDPKMFELNTPQANIKPLRLIITTFMFAIFFFTSLAPALGIAWDIGTSIQVALPVLFFAMGIYLPRVKPNYFIGVRTPWTLNDPNNWRETHIITGRMWVVTSVLFLTIEFLLPEPARKILFFVYLGSLILAPILYSFLLFQKSKRTQSPGPQSNGA